MRVAVIGGGMFGVTSALELSSRGFDVELFEKNKTILSETSAYNTWRLHKGYHYPRSDKTARECLEGSKKFRRMFPESVVSENTQRYCIASEGSKTSPDEFLDFCDRIGLEYKIEDTELVNQEKVSLSIRAQEDHIDPTILRQICRRRLRDNDVNININSEVEHVDDLLKDFDYVVVATYGRINSLVEGYERLQQAYRFEVVEIPLIELPRKYIRNNILILDGPFCCIDYRVQRDEKGSSDQFLWGDYYHTTHKSNTGHYPEIPDDYRDLINTGLIENPSLTNIDKFREHGVEYMPGLKEADYIGSYFTLRTKIPGNEDTAARPSVIKNEDRVYTLFGGKLPTSVKMAEKLADKLYS